MKRGIIIMLLGTLPLGLFVFSGCHTTREIIFTDGSRVTATVFDSHCLFAPAESVVLKADGSSRTVRVKAHVCEMGLTLHLLECEAKEYSSASSFLDEIEMGGCKW